MGWATWEIGVLSKTVLLPNQDLEDEVLDRVDKEYHDQCWPQKHYQVVVHHVTHLQAVRKGDPHQVTQDKHESKSVYNDSKDCHDDLVILLCL